MTKGLRDQWTRVLGDQGAMGPGGQGTRVPGSHGGHRAGCHGGQGAGAWEQGARGAGGQGAWPLGPRGQGQGGQGPGEQGSEASPCPAITPKYSVNGTLSGVYENTREYVYTTHVNMGKGWWCICKHTVKPYFVCLGHAPHGTARWCI